MKKTAIICTVMMVMATFCTPVFAATDIQYGGNWYNGVVVGNVGIFDETPGVGNYNVGNNVNGIGAIVDDRASSFNVLGNVGIFNGNAVGNTIVNGTGADVGWTNHATATGTVGVFSDSRYNKIEIGKGAIIADGNFNTATGTVGSFDNSYNNQLLNVWVDGNPGYSAGSVGAYVGGGDHNAATGTVGQFSYAGINNGNNSSLGNTIYASQGAVIDGGSHNAANGQVGIFTGTTLSVNATNNDQIYGNTIYSSTGARIVSGSGNTATGYVGIFNNVGADGAPQANGLSGNIINSSTGAYIENSTNSIAIGTVGSFNTSSRNWFATNNTVEGTGAAIYGGSNNLAIGTVGKFEAGSGNIVKGTGAVIGH